MKIIVCGIPPAQSRKLEQRFAGHDLRVIGAQENTRRYLAHLTACDLCVVNTQLISHTVIGAIRHAARRLLFVNGPSSATAAIESVLNEAA